MKNDAMQQRLAQLGGGAHALATQILGNADDAADAVHDAYATVLSKPEAYDSNKGPLKPWFLRVVRNRCIDIRRKRRDERLPVEDFADAGPGPEQEVQRDERSRQIEAALKTLSADAREIVILRDYVDLSYAEISDVLGIARGTVMSRLHRARLALKEALQNHE
ncbi:MAG: sigma-70 family RNA polymerase sigma factor [Pseudomonadota bacterium]